MTYSKELEDLLERCKQTKQYIGIGNPNSKILLIGKEAGIGHQQKDASGREIHDSNYDLWANKAAGHLANPFTPQDDRKGKNIEAGLRNGRHTWQKYQKLYNHISNTQPEERYRINFVANCFTTELSCLAYHKSHQAKADKSFADCLKERKEIFLKSDFIRSFPIVVIAANDSAYIKNIGSEEDHEINNIFQVKFKEPRVTTKGNQSLYIHHSTIKDKPKLVIHTRQFVNGASNELIELVANEIKHFQKTWFK